MNTVAVVQMVSQPDREANLDAAAKWVALAAEKGAKLVVLPENFAYLGMEETCLECAEEDGSGVIQDFLSKLAKKHSIWIVGGTIPIRADSIRANAKESGRVRAACLVYDDQGKRCARYDKIHLFDVLLDDTKRNYCESKRIEPGTTPVVVDTPFGRLGLAVCYDVRFPELFRHLVAEGAELFAIPAAFTAVTGKVHWDILLRTRAVENLCYVLAAAQGGIHEQGRVTYGHSMIVSPWGEIIDSFAYGPGIVIANIDREQQQRQREEFPVLTHRRIK